MDPIGMIRRCAILATALGLAACSTADPQSDLAASDPYEGFNRRMHDVNLVLDANVLRPTAQGYDFVTPTLIKHLLGNAFSHLDLPGDFANHVLQGEPDPALNSLGRFTINTVLGAGGLLDPATEFGLPKEDTDFGITLGKHGVGEGPYVVMPLLGPTTPRDTVGRIVDLAFKPTTYLGVLDPSLSPEVGLALRGTETIDARDRNADVIDDVLYESADSYVSLRSVYLQRRRAMVAGEEGAADSLPNIFDSN